MQTWLREESGERKVMAHELINWVGCGQRRHQFRIYKQEILPLQLRLQLQLQQRLFCP